MGEFNLPPDWSIQRAIVPLSETIDWSLKFFGIPDLWRQTKGKGVRVAILDTGCDVNHPDLANAIVDAEDFTGSIFGADDRVGHGTWCAGYVGARANDVGVCGVANECSLHVYKVLGDQGSGSEDSIGAAMERAIEKKCDIASMSFGGPRMSKSLETVFKRFIDGGGFIFAAAGNDGNPNSVNYPANWLECLCVGAVGKDGRPTSFSNRGPRVDFYAAGYEMLSTIPGGYGTMSGTSMSTPQGAGIGALAISKHLEHGGNTPLATVPEMRAHIKKTAKAVNGYPLIDPANLLSSFDAEQPPKPQPQVLLSGDTPLGRMTVTLER